MIYFIQSFLLIFIKGANHFGPHCTFVEDDKVQYAFGVDCGVSNEGYTVHYAQGEIPVPSELLCCSVIQDTVCLPLCHKTIHS